MIEVRYLGLQAVEYDKAILEGMSCLALPRQIRSLGQRVPNPDDSKLSYTASEVDSQDKWTELSAACILALNSGVGYDGKNYSFLFHLAPQSFTYQPKLFRGEYLSSFRKLCGLTVPETRSAIIAGGNINCFRDFAISYYDMVSYILEANKKASGLETTLISPKVDSGFTNLYYSNNDQTAYIIESGKENADSGLHQPVIARIEKTNPVFLRLKTLFGSFHGEESWV